MEKIEKRLPDLCVTGRVITPVDEYNVPIGESFSNSNISAKIVHLSYLSYSVSFLLFLRQLSSICENDYLGKFHWNNKYLKTVPVHCLPVPMQGTSDVYLSHFMNLCHPPPPTLPPGPPDIRPVIIIGMGYTYCILAGILFIITRSLPWNVVKYVIIITAIISYKK